MTIRDEMANGGRKESKAASFSRISLYEKCPASFEWQYVLGNKEAFVPGPAAQRGTSIHNMIEEWHYGNGELDEDVIPHKIAKHLNRCLVEDGWIAMPEYEFAVTKDWEPTTFDAEDAYIRGYIDCLYLNKQKKAIVIDEYKTGQEYDDHADQKQLYALICMCLFPEYKLIDAYGVYIDKDKIVPTKYDPIFKKTLQLQWSKRIGKMHLPIYPHRPGRHCMWCPKSKSSGGPCKVG